MGVFKYSAVDATGKEETGMLEADSSRKVTQLLKRKGLRPLEILQENSKASKNDSVHVVSGNKLNLSIGDLSLMTRELANLIGSGMPLDDALHVMLSDTEKTKVKQVLLGLRSKILEGYSLGASMEEFPRIFSSVFQASVRAGEKSGNLDTMLWHMADYLESTHNLRQKIFHALIYPAFMTLVSFAVVGFLLVYIVPTIVDVFSQNETALPFITKMLLQLSNWVTSYGLWVLTAIAGFFGVFWLILKNPKQRRRFHLWLLRVPTVAKFIRLLDTTRFCQTFGILVQSGVNVLEALNISASVMNNQGLQARLIEAGQKVKEGTLLPHALKQAECFTPMTLHFISNGVATGQVANMALRAATMQQTSIERFTATALALFEPILILVMGGVVLFVVLAILLPMFDMSQMLT